MVEYTSKILFFDYFGEQVAPAFIRSMHERNVGVDFPRLEGQEAEAGSQGNYSDLFGQVEEMVRSGKYKAFIFEPIEPGFEGGQGHFEKASTALIRDAKRKGIGVVLVSNGTEREIFELFDLRKGEDYTAFVAKPLGAGHELTACLEGILGNGKLAVEK